MPLLAIPVIVGVGAWLGSVVSGWGQQTANTLTDTNTPQSSSSFPSWVIPTVIIGVGALLLYKEGAKLLKL